MAKPNQPDRRKEDRTLSEAAASEEEALTKM
jgi:hypothetical protein